MSLKTRLLGLIGVTITSLCGGIVCAQFLLQEQYFYAFLVILIMVGSSVWCYSYFLQLKEVVTGVIPILEESEKEIQSLKNKIELMELRKKDA